VPVDGKAGALAVFDHVVFGQLRDPADQHPEQQDERSPDPQVQGHGLVSEAPVKLLDMVVLGEQPRRLLARGKRHRQIAGQAASLPISGRTAPQPAHLAGWRRTCS
jgi:hypothetical protein